MPDVYRGATKNASKRKCLFHCHDFLLIWVFIHSNVSGIYERRSAPNVKLYNRHVCGLVWK